MNARQKVRKRKKDVLKLYIAVIALISLGLFFFFIKFTPLLSNHSTLFIDSVLLQLNKDYRVSIDNDRICLNINNKKEIKDAFIELKELINKENGYIEDYKIKKQGKDLFLTLFIKPPNDEGKIFNIIIKKEYTQQKEVQYDIPLIRKSFQTKSMISIIIDDAGYNNKLIYSFIELPVKMGIAVLPFLKNSKKDARMIYEHNKEVLLHMPMEPKDYKTRNLKLMRGEILTDMGPAEIYKAMGEMLGDIEYAAGINNHQGSEATADKGLMHAVLSKVKRKNMFFIDSLTSSRSVTENLAREMKVNYGIRDVFLDNEDDYDYIENQMKQLIRTALKKGRAIGIGHINSENLYKVIRDYIPVIKEKKIEMVYPSEIINKFYNKEVTKNVTENINYLN